jgi:hypothetical protein
MSVALEQDVIHLSGPCRVEDAEPLVALLLEDRRRSVNMENCTALHTAVIQAILAFRPRIAVPASHPVIYGLLLQFSESGNAAKTERH